MKKLLILFAFLIFNFSNSQNNLKNDEFRDWENPENFEKFCLKKVSSYSIKINKKGKTKKDSILLSEYNYDKSKSEIYGIFHYVRMYMHGNESHLEFYNFKNNYTKDGLILKKANTTISREKKKKDEVEFNTNYETFEYDSLKRKSKKTYFVESNSIGLIKKDTFSYSKSIYSPKITEYEYDFKNRIIKELSSQDSVTYFYKSNNQKEFKISKVCGYCEPKYLQQESIYDGDNLTKHISYTYKKEVHTKKYHYYNSNNQLIKEIDSTGFYLTKPYLSSITEFDYSDKTKTEIETNFDRDSYYKRETRKYNLEDELFYEFSEAETSNYNLERNIEYSNNSKTVTTKNPHNLIHKETFLYDKRGLLIEKKIYYNAILTELIKYYYE